MYPEKEKTASGATNTEDGQTKESEPSVPTLEEKVKFAQAAGPIHIEPVPNTNPIIPLDVRTEMFMLNELREVLKSQYGIDGGTKYNVLSAMIARCVGVDEE